MRFLSIQFKDSLFYDISAWSFDLAFINFESVNTLDNAGTDYEQIWKKGFVSKKSEIGYLMEWTDHKAQNY
jgi:hypothetical protein